MVDIALDHPVSVLSRTLLQGTTEWFLCSVEDETCVVIIVLQRIMQDVIFPITYF